MRNSLSFACAFSISDIATVSTLWKRFFFASEEFLEDILKPVDFSRLPCWTQQSTVVVSRVQRVKALHLFMKHHHNCSQNRAVSIQ